ncbi:hypothetical protein BJV82DRAFT_660056 [Fennellomyces sp. T-0311]|nr:hypothetical protein BJV82DRAFT_660056 [Fennellomyces sp. T-0311]
MYSSKAPLYQSHHATEVTSMASHEDEYKNQATEQSSDDDKKEKYPQEKKKRSPTATSFMTKLSSARDLLGMIFLPILNVVVSLALMGTLIYIYISANGKNIDYTMAGMKVPSLVALITTLLKMFVAGGIGYAVSEYKWVRLQDGGSLSLIEIYDACTRGVGGAIRVLFSIRIDYILVPAIIFQLGLIALGPAAQTLITIHEQSFCEYSDASRLNYNNLSQTHFSSLRYPFDQRSNFGLKHSYFITYGFDSASGDSDTSINYSYDTKTINITFPNIEMMETDIECREGSFSETQIINNQTRTAQTLAEYFGSTVPVAPRVFFSGSMFNRTIYDLVYARVPVFLQEGISPGARAVVGDQTFVIFSYKGQASVATIERPEDAVVHECTLRTYKVYNNITTGLGQGHTLIHNEKKELVDMDYNLLCNASHWYERPEGPSMFMLNAYSYQLSLINNLNILKSSVFQNRLADGWAKNNPDRNTIENFMRDTFSKTDQALSFLRPEYLVRGIVGIGCFKDDTIYRIDPVAFYILSLICLIPLVWWLVMWIIGLYQTNGISRGNSQIALLVTGFTKRAADQFKGLSHTGQQQLFEKATDVNIYFGEVKRMDNKPGHVAFGLENELHPLRTRRRSLTRA